MRKLRKGGDADGLKGDKEKLKGVIVIKNKQLFFETVVCFIAVCYLYLYFAFLKNIDSEEIFIEFTTNINPCIIRPADDVKYTYLLLPVRISSNI